jgi:hypothetical protein
MQEEVLSPDVSAESSPATVDETIVESGATETQEEVKKPNPVQERINKLTREKYEARQKAEEYERRLKELEAKIPQQKAQEMAAPNEGDYQRYSDYQAAQADYIAKRAAAEAYARVAAETRSKEEAGAIAAKQESFNAKKASFDQKLEAKRGQFQDFEEIAYGHQFISETMAARIFDSEKGPEIAYHLGSHLDEAERIFKLDPISQAVELTKLEYQVKTLTPKRVSGAPDPITPIGSKESVQKSEANMTDEEWIKWRYQQLNARNKHG